MVLFSLSFPSTSYWHELREYGTTTPRSFISTLFVSFCFLLASKVSFAGPSFVRLCVQRSTHRVFFRVSVSTEDRWSRSRQSSQQSRATNASYDGRESKRSWRFSKNSYVFSSMYRLACVSSSTSFFFTFFLNSYPSISEATDYLHNLVTVSFFFFLVFDTFL